MQVLNGSDFEQKNVLVGGGKTEAFGVTNDPVLMGMLSTGLYSKPMRTMIQEIMFNAWDAHRMGKCQDRPIDIYINDTSGLIVRDYGPGIKPTEMRPIYCVYGNSTKRDDDDQTGGFGLGSKSPYAYTDSFTVTSHHAKMKSMYIMNRVSEENDGGPGMTTIIQEVPTDETGLLVTVPLKTESDQDRVHRYVHELLYLSGIKANIHYNGETTLVESESLKAGEWVVANDNDHGHDLWAVYGGVRYKIPDDEAYSDEYRFVKKMSEMLGTFFIGFKASTLTPLPNREALNLNEQTVSHIKSQLEIMEESFRAILNPVVRVCLKESIKSLKESGIEPKFLAYAWHKMGETTDLRKVIDENHPVVSAIREQCSADLNQSMWNSVANVAMNSTRKIIQLISPEKFNQMKYVIWAKTFPDYKHYKSFMFASSLNSVRKTLSQIEGPKSVADVISAQKLVNEVTGRDNDIRFRRSSDSWDVVVNIRGGGTAPTKGLTIRQKNVIKALGKDKIIVPTQEHPDRLWFKKDGDELTPNLFTKQIILAKTLGALKETGFDYQSMFTPNYPNVSHHHNFHRSNFGYNNYGSYSLSTPVPALVVHQKGGGYDTALQALLDAGWTVHEADEPEIKARPTQGSGTSLAPTPRGPITYPLYGPQFDDWADWNNEVENPTCYVCVTEHKVRNAYSSDLPDKKLMAYVAQNTPRFVILHNKARAGRLEKKGIPSFDEKLQQLVKKLVSNEERMLTMYLLSQTMADTPIPENVLYLPEVQKFFGIPYTRTKQRQAFERDLQVIEAIKDLYRHNEWVSRETKQLVVEARAKAREHPSFSVVRERLDSAQLLDGYKLKSHTRHMKPGELKVFSEKMMRFIRTV